MYAVISTGGKQYRVMKDDVIDIERVEGDPGKEVSFGEVLAIGEGGSIEIGTPLLASATVEGKILEHFRGKKLVAFKMKRRKSYRRKIGHRQELTKVLIEKINSKSDTKAEKPVAKKEAEETAPKSEKKSAKPTAATEKKTTKTTDKKSEKKPTAKKKPTVKKAAGKK
ncbi:MAG: 50S ribosomal protein L21 [Victivallales bacterium]|nr:50S ribosomal protein L21 [Victivallales bacterium]